MKQLNFKKKINAPASKVYTTMLGLDNIETYEQWTAAFNPVSTYEGSWEKGSKILFTGSDEEGNSGGMIAEIAENIPSRFVSIRHYGVLEGDKEITEGPQIEKWAGALENYTFEEDQGVTTVSIEVDVAEDYIDFFNATWPKALDMLRELTER